MAEKTSSGRVAGLDGLRGCAILLVIAGHAAAPQNEAMGAAGVTVFFVLSGYLISGILLRSTGGRRGETLRGFYVRRAARLLPALGLLLTFEVALRWSTGQSMLPVVLAATYSSNIALSLGYSSTLTHTWSLAMEEQFYILWPLLVPFVVRRRSGVAVLLSIAAGSAFARTMLYVRDPEASTFAYFSPLTRADAIVVGCALALALHQGRLSDPTRRTASTAGILALGALALPLLWGSRDASVALMPIVAGAAAVLIAVVSTSNDAWISRMFGIHPLRWAGRVSYGMYLWHPLALTLAIAVGATSARFALTTALAGGVAAISWFVLERPILESRWARRANSVAVARPGRRNVSRPPHPSLSPPGGCAEPSG